MKFNFFFYLVCFLVFTACKKNTADVAPGDEQAYADSVSFSIDGKSYIFSEQNTAGIGNRQINIKPSITLINDQEWEYNTGGFYWYGEKDSLLYDTFYGFTSEDSKNRINISFSRKYHKNALQKVFPVLAPEDNSEIFKVGVQPFAVDLNLENTMDGISIEVKTQELATQLSSYIPAFSIMIRTDLSKNIQNNSRFEITKVQKLDEKFHLIEGRFEVNLFDGTGKLYRLEKGFFRLKTTMKVYNVFEQV